MCLLLDKSQPPDPGKTRILVVDDEPTLRLGFAYALTGKSAIVETANNGRQALERLAEKSFDVIILDLRMPELDGIGVLEALRANGNRIPVILCSAALGSESAVRAIRHGVVDFLLKPVLPAELRKAVEFCLRPDRDPFSQALAEARRGHLEKSVKILEEEASACPRTAYWLPILRAILHNGEISHLEGVLRSNLPKIAFNSP